MTDSAKTPKNPRRVATDEEEEVNYWCTKFRCSKDDLTNAVKSVGTSAEVVEEYLRMFGHHL